MSTSSDEVDVQNNQLGAWLDEQRFRARAGNMSFRFVVDENGVTVMETTDLASGRKSVTQVLSRESSVYMAMTEAPPVARKKK